VGNKNEDHSKLCGAYSRMHKKWIEADDKYKAVYAADFDGLWTEVDYENGKRQPFALIDCKYNTQEFEHQNDVFDFMLQKKAVKFCFYMKCKMKGEDIESVSLIDYVSGEVIDMTSLELAEFMYELHNPDKRKDYWHRELKAITEVPRSQIKELFPKIWELFFQPLLTDPKAERQEGEGLHDYFMRKGITCFCPECRKAK